MIMAAIAKFFAIPLGQFRAEWADLSEQDKADLKKGMSDGTYTY